MKKYSLVSIVFFIICFFTISCGDDKPEASISIVGEWRTEERTLLIDDPKYDAVKEAVNNLFKEHQKTYYIIRNFQENGSCKTTFVKITDPNIVPINKEGAYRLEKDTLYLDDNRQNVATKSKYILSQNILTTYRKVNADDMKYLIREVGGLSESIIPTDAVGVLKMKEIR